MFTISKTFAFCASHRLEGLPPGHPCARMHGHNYVVEVAVSANALNTVGFVIDYRDLAPCRDFIDSKLDHRHLNDCLPEGVNPTAEEIARWLHGVFCSLLPVPPANLAVAVCETPKTRAEYRP